MLVLLRLLFLVPQVVETALHHRPEINHDLIDCFKAGAGILIKDAGIHQRDIRHEFVKDFSGIAGQVIHLSGSDILDQEIQHDIVVVKLLVDHRLNIRDRFCEPQIIQCDATGGSARKLIGAPGIHITVFKDIAECFCRTDDDCLRHLIRLIQHCLQDLFRIDL